jgi:hypothetical protein
MDELSVLKASLSTWDALADISACLVLVGVILLSTAQFEWLTQRSGLARFPQWRQPVGRIGAVLLIAALAGEILSARRSHDINDRITAILNARAAAATEAAKALEKEAAQLRLQLAKLKWRVITPEQQAALVEMLRNVPKGPVIVLYKLDDEPQSFAIQIRDALKAAGFDPNLEQSPIASNLSGTWLLVTDLQRPPPHAVPIQNAFREIHVDLDGQQDPQHVPNAGMVVVLVGARRP